MKPTSSTKYEYALITKATNLFAIGILAYIEFLLVPGLFSTQTPFELGVVAILCLVVIIFRANYSQDFLLTPDGVEVTLFGFWPKFIKWEEIVEIRKPALSLGRYFLLVSDQLTVAHRVIGLFSAFTLRPCFIVDRSLPLYTEALETLEGKLQTL